MQEAYQVLNLDPTKPLTMKELKKHYRIQAKKCHPDAGLEADSLNRNQQFQMLTNSYQMLLELLKKEGELGPLEEIEKTNSSETQETPKEPKKENASETKETSKETEKTNASEEASKKPEKPRYQEDAEKVYEPRKMDAPTWYFLDEKLKKNQEVPFFKKSRNIQVTHFQEILKMIFEQKNLRGLSAKVQALQEIFEKTSSSFFLDMDLYSYQEFLQNFSKFWNSLSFAIDQDLSRIRFWAIQTDQIFILKEVPFYYFIDQELPFSQKKYYEDAKKSLKEILNDSISCDQVFFCHLHYASMATFSIPVRVVPLKNKYAYCFDYVKSFEQAFQRFYHQDPNQLGKISTEPVKQYFKTYAFDRRYYR